MAKKNQSEDTSAANRGDSESSEQKNSALTVAEARRTLQNDGRTSFWATHAGGITIVIGPSDAYAFTEWLLDDRDAVVRLQRKIQEVYDKSKTRNQGDDDQAGDVLRFQPVVDATRRGAYSAGEAGREQGFTSIADEQTYS